MSHRTVVQDHVAEGSVLRLTGTLKDEAGTALPLANVSALTVVIYDEATGAVLLAETNVLNANDGTLHATSGAWSLTISGAAQLAIQDAASKQERHVALVKWTYTGGKVGYHEFVHLVKNLAKAP